MTASVGRETPAVYRIRVTGRLDAHWTDWFDGFTLTGEPDGTTTIAGAVTDQAQLHRLLAKIRDLGLALVSLEVSPPPGTPEAKPAART